MLRLNVRMPKADLIETTLHGCITLGPTMFQLATLWTVHHRLLLLRLGMQDET